MIVPATQAIRPQNIRPPTSFSSASEPGRFPPLGEIEMLTANGATAGAITDETDHMNTSLHRLDRPFGSAVAAEAHIGTPNAPRCRGSVSADTRATCSAARQR